MDDLEQPTQTSGYFFDLSLTSYLPQISYDLAPIAEVDDEYWYNDDPALAMKQPPNVPSRASCFAYYLKMTDILAFAQRTLFVLVFSLRHRIHLTINPDTQSENEVPAKGKERLGLAILSKSWTLQSTNG